MVWYISIENPVKLKLLKFLEPIHFPAECSRDNNKISLHFTLDHFDFHFSEPFVVGGQPGDDRVFVEERKERAPDYTEGEE